VKPSPLRTYPLIALICAMAAVSFGAVSCAKSDASVAFNRELGKVDRLIAEGNRKKAEKALAKLRKSALSSIQWLSIAKRERGLGNNRESLVTLRAGEEALPSSVHIRAVLAATMSELGLYEQSAAYGQALSGTPYSAIPAYAALRLIAANSSALFPAELDPATWDRVDAALPNPEFKKNAAMLHAAKGDYLAALRSIETLADSDAYLCALLAYDAGMLDLAKRYLGNFSPVPPEEGAAIVDLPSIALRADLAVKAGVPADARALWILISRTNPDYSPVTVYNLAVTSLSEADARESLEADLALFPDYYPAVANYARRASFESNTHGVNDPIFAELESAGFMTESMREIARERPVSREAAEAAIAKAIAAQEAKSGGGVDARLYVERTRLGWLSQRDAGRTAGELWQLLERFPTDEAVRSWACWFFAATRNFSAGYAANNRPDAAPLPLYAALDLAAAGKEEPALAAFESVPESDAAVWCARANRAVIHAKRGEIGSAVENLLAAAAIAPGKGVQSRLHAAAGSLLAKSRDEKRARDEYSYALELDPANHQAASALAVLNAGQ